MKYLPLSIQTFSKLLSGGGEYFFLSRPRRFGKSLLISTLAEIFSGNQELFKGLWIYDKIQWTQHPVIHIDFSNIDFGQLQVLDVITVKGVTFYRENPRTRNPQQAYSVS